MFKDGNHEGRRPDAIVPSAYGDEFHVIDVKNRKLHTDWRNPEKRYFSLDKEEAEELLVTEEALSKRVLLFTKEPKRRRTDWYARYLSEALNHPTTRMSRDRDGKPYYLFALDEFLPLDLYVNEEGMDVTALNEELYKTKRQNLN